MEPITHDQEAHLNELRSTIETVSQKYMFLDYDLLKAEILAFKGEGVELIASVLALKAQVEFQKGIIVDLQKRLKSLEGSHQQLLQLLLKRFKDESMDIG